MTNLKKAAQVGAKWLDTIHPGWAMKIDLKTLQLRNENLCVLGQCFGNFWAALDEYAPKQMNHFLNSSWVVKHGFNLDDATSMNNGAYERLGLAWAPLIAVRQVNGGQTS